MFEDVRWPIRATPSVYIECDAVSWKDAHVPWNRDAAAFKYLPSLSSAGSPLENETLLHETIVSKLVSSSSTDNLSGLGLNEYSR